MNLVVPIVLATAYVAVSGVQLLSAYRDYLSLFDGLDGDGKLARTRMATRVALRHAAEATARAGVILLGCVWAEGRETEDQARCLVLVCTAILLIGAASVVYDIVARRRIEATGGER